MLNRDTRSLSAVGRIACERGDASVRPPRRPPTMRISFPLASLAAEAAAALLAPRQLRLTQALGLGRVTLRRRLLCPCPFSVIPRWSQSGPRGMTAVFAVGGPCSLRLAISDRSYLRMTRRDLVLRRSRSRDRP